jgi:hypothetical protein
MVHARAEVGDHLQLLAGAVDQGRVDLVGDGGHQNLGPLNGGFERRTVHGRVLEVQLGVEKLAHTGLDRIREASG